MKQTHEHFLTSNWFPAFKDRGDPVFESWHPGVDTGKADTATADTEADYPELEPAVLPLWN